MYLSAYHFTGDPASLLAGHERLLAGIPSESIELHIVLSDGSGITVVDSCPSRAVFEDFSTSSDFRETIAAVGLPSPRIQPLGDVDSLILPQSVQPR